MVRDSREAFKTYQKVFDNFTHRNLFKLASQGYFDDLKSIIGPGKEAVVFSAARKNDTPVAVKIYLLETANFRKMYGYIRVDPRYHDLRNMQRQVIFSWTEREYRNLLLARDAGVRVPMPIAHKDNILVMELIGKDGVPSPRLKQATPEDPEHFAKQCLKMLEDFTKAGMVHGDLSEYNILNMAETPVFIDFSHAVPLKASNTDELLIRDIHNVCNYFERLGVKTDEEALTKRMLAIHTKMQ